jgi:hypothetical protein
MLEQIDCGAPAKAVAGGLRVTVTVKDAPTQLDVLGVTRYVTLPGLDVLVLNV